jgi:hypothetical protein
MSFLISSVFVLFYGGSGPATGWSPSKEPYHSTSTASFMLLSFLAYYSTLKIMATYSSKSSGGLKRTTRRCIRKLEIFLASLMFLFGYKWCYLNTALMPCTSAWSWFLQDAHELRLGRYWRQTFSLHTCSPPLVCLVVSNAFLRCQWNKGLRVLQVLSIWVHVYLSEDKCEDATIPNCRFMIAEMMYGGKTFWILQVSLSRGSWLASLSRQCIFEERRHDIYWVEGCWCGLGGGEKYPCPWCKLTAGHLARR